MGKTTQKQELILATDFDMDEVMRLLSRGFNIYEICVKFSYSRHALVEAIKADPKLIDRATEARRQGADALVATYKDMLMQEIKMADDSKDRISLIKELGTHIRWEATAVHQGTYANKLIQEHVGELKHKHNVVLTPAQMRAMAEEVLSTGGTDFTDDRERAGSTH